MFCKREQQHKQKYSSPGHNASRCRILLERNLDPERHPDLGCFQASKTFMALEAFSPPATHLTLWRLFQRAISSALGHEARCPGGDIVTGHPELVAAGMSGMIGERTFESRASVLTCQLF